METFSNKHAPGLFAQLYKSILNDDKEKPSKKHMEMQKTRVVSLLITQSQLHGNQVYVLIPRGLFTRNTNPFPDFKLSSHHWKFIFYIVTRTAPFASYLDSEWKCKIGIDTTDISLEAHSSAKGPFSTYFWLQKLSNRESDLPKSKNERSQL